MSRKKYTEEQIIAVLNEAEAWGQYSGVMSQAWDEQSHLLQVESQVR